MEDTKTIGGLDDFIVQTMNNWNVPGVAVGIVKGGELCYSRGFGFRNIEERLPVTPETLFGIGSCTKSFTSFSAGLLVDEGIINWDTPVIEYLPAFKMYDGQATNNSTMMDLLTHRTGLPRHDGFWYFSNFSREKLMSSIPFLEPNKPFRSTFEYQNTTYMIAGYLIEHLLQTEWETFVTESIFRKVNMEKSNLSIAELELSDNYSKPYEEMKEEVQEIQFQDIGKMNPSGGINSNILDMAKWLLVHLNKGKIGDKAIINESTLHKMHTPQVATEDIVSFKELKRNHYGLGWYVQPYRDHDLLYHDGYMDGFSAMTSFMPDEGIGVVVLSNLSYSPLPSIITYRIYDRLLGLSEIPWNERMMKNRSDHEKIQRGKMMLQKMTKHSKENLSSLLLEQFVGDYVHPGYGKVSICIKEDLLILNFHRLVSTLKHYGNNVFYFEYKSSWMFYVTFNDHSKDIVESLEINFEPSIGNIKFIRSSGSNY